MLKYNIIQQRNALNANSEVMYYPRLTESHKYDLDYVADIISRRSSLTKGDIVSTLVSLENVIPELLRRGGRVELGNLGSFSLQSNAATSSKKSGVTWRSFLKLTTRFRAGKALKIRMEEVKFSLSSKKTA